MRKGLVESGSPVVQDILDRLAEIAENTFNNKVVDTCKLGIILQ